MALEHSTPGPSPIPEKTQEAMRPDTIKTPFKNNREKKQYKKFRKEMKDVCILYNTTKDSNIKCMLDNLIADDAVNSLIKNKLPSKFALLLQYEIKHFKRKIKPRKWTLKNKITAIILYHRSPTVYRLLRRLFSLPKPSTLKFTLKQLYLEEGLNNKQYLRALRLSVRCLMQSQNQFILMFDQITLQQNLEYDEQVAGEDGDHVETQKVTLQPSSALVFMVASLKKKVEQPIAYFLYETSLTSSQLADYIKTVIVQCLVAKIRIVATVCDMNKINRNALTTLGATVDHPEIVISGHEIVTLFDVPHLLKNFRNLFLEYDIQVVHKMVKQNSLDFLSHNRTTPSSGTGTAKWSYIKTFYENDKDGRFEFAPGLKDAHLAPSKAQKRKVHLASQLLSHNVFIGLLDAIACGHIPPEADVTAIMVTRMNQLYESLTADNPEREGTSFDVNISNNSPHKELFETMRLFFKTLKFIDIKYAPLNLEGWVWTMNGTEKLWSNLFKARIGFRSLATKRLQKDPIVKLFKYIKRNRPKRPTKQEFVEGLKTAILSKLYYPTVEEYQYEMRPLNKSAALIKDFEILTVHED